jgi:uncharacterized protein YgbK (DUF1537 family)
VFAGQVHRLDRHPVMSRHPSTPMHEADLRQVLAEQFTDRQVPAAVHLPAYADGSFTERWTACQAESVPAFVVDAVTDDHLDEVARALRGAGQTSGAHPSVVVGSGGIMAALARTATGREARQPGPQHASGPVLAVSASASSTTAAQIGDAVTHGWADVAVPVDLLKSDDPDLAATSRSTPPQHCPRAATSWCTPRGAARTRDTRRPVRSTRATSAGCSAPSPGAWPPPGSPATSPCWAATPPATP